MMRADDFVQDDRIPDITYRTEAPEEIVSPRVTQVGGAWVVYLHNERHGPTGGHLPVGQFLMRLARRELNLAATGYRANRRQTTISFNKSERVSLSPRLQTYLASLLASPDDEAQRFLDGFMDPQNPQFTFWLPHFRDSLSKVRDAIRRDAHDELFELVWKGRENGIANAGRGMIADATADRLRSILVDVIRDIAQDGSPKNFDAIVARFKQLRANDHIDFVPHLLIARAFAAIHPERYHTTVDAESQERLLQWFVEHTGFEVPAGSWAWKAAALTVHLDRSGMSFGESLECRNMFPWFVLEQMRDATGRVPFVAGHTQKAEAGLAITAGGSTQIEYRHNLIQERLYALLCERHGKGAVRTEAPTGTGGRADAVVRHADDSLELYEIKVARHAADAVRDAMGQLLEYAFRHGGLEPQALHVVSEPPLDALTDAFLKRVREQFGINIHYLQVVL
jgi:hypothetical protein